MIIPTPEDFAMKWLPKRQAILAKELLKKRKAHLKSVVGYLKDGKTLMLVPLLREQADVDALRQTLKGAGWSIEIEKEGYDHTKVKLSPLDTQTTE